jgi:hypothetical protein
LTVRLRDQHRRSVGQSRHLTRSMCAKQSARRPLEPWRQFLRRRNDGDPWSRQTRSMSQPAREAVLERRHPALASTACCRTGCRRSASDRCRRERPPSTVVALEKTGNRMTGLRSGKCTKLIKRSNPIAAQPEWTGRPWRCFRRILREIFTRSGIACRQGLTFRAASIRKKT